MEVIKTGKLHAYIGPDNYIYTRSSARRNVTYYSCRKKDCLGRANVRNDVFRTTEQHGHPVDLEQVKRFRFRHRLQMRAAEETISIAEIYKQESSAMGGVPGLKLKSVNRGMYRARHGELPPPPKSISELAALLVDEKWKDKMLYSYGEDREEFFKACLQSEDASTQIVFMSPTFEDFARTGAPLRLHMDSAFKIKPACGEGSEYVALHMYIGTILYPFVHMFTSLKSYYAYFSLMKYVSDFIPNLNVEIFVSNDQESIEAAYTVFPKAVKSYYQPREKDKDATNNKKETDLSDVEMFNKEFTRRLWPKPGVWRFIETLKEIDFSKLCDFYKLRNKRVPNRYPKKLAEAEVQTETPNEDKIRVNSEAQTIPPSNIKKYFSEFKPFLSQIKGGPGKGKGKGKRGYLSSSTHNFSHKRAVLIPKSIMKGDVKKLAAHFGLSKNKPIVIKKIICKSDALDGSTSPSKQIEEDVIVTTINAKNGAPVNLEVLLNPRSNSSQEAETSKKPIILRRSPKTQIEVLDNKAPVIISNEKLKTAKIVRVEKLATSLPKMPELSQQKRKDLKLIERQLAEMEGTEVLEDFDDDDDDGEVPQEEEEVVEVVTEKRKRGRPRKTYKNLKKAKVLEDTIETLNEEELNSDDGEIETLELSDGELEQLENQTYEHVETCNDTEMMIEPVIHIEENFNTVTLEEVPMEKETILNENDSAEILKDEKIMETTSIPILPSEETDSTEITMTVLTEN